MADWLLEGTAPEGYFLLEEVDDEYVEKSLVHEVCHLLFRDLRWSVVDALEDEISGALKHALHSAMLRAEEQAVDLLARALVREWPS